MTKGKVVLVPFPFDDLSSNKVRPAIVLCDPVGQHRHIVLSFITSVIPDRLEETDILVDDSHPDFSATGLRGPSVIRLHRLMTVPTAIIQRELGELPPSLSAEVGVAVRKLFDL
jgi:mRNA interferase MazF